MKFTQTLENGNVLEFKGETTLRCINIGARVLDNDTYETLLETVAEDMDGEVTVFGFHETVVKLINQNTGIVVDIKETFESSLYKV